VDGLGELQFVPGFDFDLLAPGNVIGGPAIVWTPITTVVVGARQTARVGAYRDLVIAPDETSGTSARRTRRLSTVVCDS
jgi:N-methylhydantoinase A